MDRSSVQAGSRDLLCRISRLRELSGNGEAIRIIWKGSIMEDPRSLPTVWRGGRLCER